MNSPIISVTALKELLKDPSSQAVVIDCRFSLADTSLGEQQYQQGHIPGAHYFHLDRDLSGPKQPNGRGGRHPLPDPEPLTQKLRAAGVNALTPVVVYDDSRFGFAARAWWLLRYLGHEQVAVLDGGYQAWLQAGEAVDKRAPASKAGQFEPAPRRDWIVDIDEIRQDMATATPQLTLIDSREARRYQGFEEPIDPIAGHIPGALNRPWQEVSNEQGFAVSAEAQQARWQGLQGRSLAVYCGSGVTACANLLSLAIAGIPAKLYPGSWSDWCAYPDTPKYTADGEAGDLN